MSADSPSEEVFTDVDPDPDAVLAEFGVESPDDLADADADGVHDPIPDTELDVDDTTAAELFDDLQDVDAQASSREADASSDHSVDEHTQDDHSDDESAQSDHSDDDPVQTDTTHPDDLEFEFIGDADVTVRDDGEVIESTAADLSALTTSEASPSESTVSPAGFGPADSSSFGETVEFADNNDSDDIETADSRRTLTVRSSSADGLKLVGPDPTPTRVTNERFSRGDAAAR